MCKSKDQMNLDLCIYEAVSYTLGTMEAAVWAWLQLLRLCYQRRNSRRWLLVSKLPVLIQQYAAEAPPTTSLPTSRKFWHSLMVNNPSSHVRFLLLRLDTNSFLARKVGSTEYKGHLQSKRSTTERDITTKLPSFTYSL